VYLVCYNQSFHCGRFVQCTLSNARCGMDTLYTHGIGLGESHFFAKPKQDNQMLSRFTRCLGRGYKMCSLSRKQYGSEASLHKTD
jgi:hypothetical protein